jgi:opacity protein-like surface antigen
VTAQLYGGAVFFPRTNDTEESSLGSSAVAQNLKVNTNFTVGGRIGYWVDAEKLDWLGIGLDVFYFRAKAPTQTVPTAVTGLGTISARDDFSLPVLGIGFDLVRLRAPIFRSEAFPHGRLQPYVAGGPALFITRASSPDGFQPPNQRKTDVALGYKAGGGMTYLFTKAIGGFVEYRFTHFTSEMSFQDTTPPASTETFKTPLNTHHVIVGLSVHLP